MFFRRLKGLEFLSAQDRDWAKRVSRETSMQAISDCLASDNACRLRFLIENSLHYEIGFHGFRYAMLGCVQQGALDALAAVMTVSNLGAFGMPHLRRQLVLDMYDAAAKAGSAAAWEMISTWNAKTGFAKDVEPRLLAQSLVRHEAEVLLATLLDQAGDSRGPLFADALTAALARPDAAPLKMVLRHATEMPQLQPALNAALDRAAGDGSLEKARLLLQAGAGVDHDGDQPLWNAAVSGRFEMIDLLVRHGADVATSGRAIAARLHGMKLPQMAEYILSHRADALRTLDRQKLAQERFSLAGPETLAETVALPAGGTLTMLFNFATRQQIIMLQQDAQAEKAPSVRVVSFADIENPEVIDRAAQKLLDLGGDPAIVAAYRSRRNILPKKNPPSEP